MTPSEMAVDAVLRLHEKVTSTLEAVSVLSDGDGDGEWQDVDPDSFEGIVGRETICGSCLKPWPCATIQAITEATEAARG